MKANYRKLWLTCKAAAHMLHCDGSTGCHSAWSALSYDYYAYITENVCWNPCLSTLMSTLYSIMLTVENPAPQFLCIAGTVQLNSYMWNCALRTEGYVDLQSHLGVVCQCIATPRRHVRMQESLRGTSDTLSVPTSLQFDECYQASGNRTTAWPHDKLFYKLCFSNGCAAATYSNLEAVHCFCIHLAGP